jgi:hypothetical protein
MSAQRTGASDGVHPLAKPFLFLFAPGFGRWIVLGLVVAMLAGFGLEFLLAGEEGLSKYPEVLGCYEVLPFLAATGAILLAWLVRWILGVSPNFYERAAGDDIDEEGTR